MFSHGSCVFLRQEDSFGVLIRWIIPITFTFAALLLETSIQAHNNIHTDCISSDSYSGLEEHETHTDNSHHGIFAPQNKPDIVHANTR
jgi:hypothetical protein